MVQYVRVWLSFLQSTLERAAPVVAQKNINLEILRKLKIAMPPEDLVEHFCQSLSKQLNVDESYRKYLSQIESLFSSLQNRAFSGQP